MSERFYKDRFDTPTGWMLLVTDAEQRLRAASHSSSTTTGPGSQNPVAQPSPSTTVTVMRDSPAMSTNSREIGAWVPGRNSTGCGR